MSFSGIRFVALSLEQVQDLPSLRSSFKSEYVYRLKRGMERGHPTWTLQLERLSTPYQKLYDNGRVHEWIEANMDASSARDFRFLGATADGSVRGLITWRHEAWNNSIVLVDIRTHEQWRGRGIGSALLKELKRVAKKRRARGVSVETQINNVPAISFYQKHGFAISGFNDHLYSNRDLEEQDVAVFLFWEAE